MPEGRADDDDLYLALAAVLMGGMDLGDEPAPVPSARADEYDDDLSVLRRRRHEEHALARSRHPSARGKRSA